MKGNLVVDGVKLILGIRAMLSFPGPVMIFAVMQCSFMFCTINLVPLHKPQCILSVRSNIIGGGVRTQSRGGQIPHAYAPYGEVSLGSGKRYLE